MRAAAGRRVENASSLLSISLTLSLSLCFSLSLSFACFNRLVISGCSPLRKLHARLFALKIENTTARPNVIKVQQTRGGNVGPRQVRGYLSAS